MSPKGMRLLTFSPRDETLETPPISLRFLPYRGGPKHINYCFIEPLKARPRQNLAASKMGTTGMQGA